MKLTILVAATAALFVTATSSFAVTLDVRGGQLFGASDVVVSGVAYDVEFLNMSCVDLYDGCDDISDFAFQTEAAADAASQALLDTVFLDGPLGDFDRNPQLTNGVSSGGGAFVLTPFGFVGNGLIFASQAQNRGTGSISDSVVDIPSELSPNNSLGSSSSGTWAKWSTANTTVAPVPLPAGGLLLLSGLLGFVGLTRRKKYSA